MCRAIKTISEPQGRGEDGCDRGVLLVMKLDGVSEVGAGVGGGGHVDDAGTD